MFKKSLFTLLAALAIFMGGCADKAQESKPEDAKPPVVQEEAKVITVATTTSTEDSGLLDFLLPEFKKDSGIEVKIVAKGTGEAIEIAKRGDADAILVHAKAREVAFVEEGYGVERFDVMYNDFILVGPAKDPAGIKEGAYNDPDKAFKLLSDSKATFVSRGDDSGTHTKELSFWKALEIEPSGNWYVSAGKGMGAVLQMAEEMGGYTLADRATYLSMKDKLSLEIVCEKSEKLYNQYGVIKVNPDKFEIKDKEAQAFVDWMISEKGQKLIEEFGKKEYGQSLFIPNAK